ncbi:hypothetical protein [Rhodococcus sp. FH8]|uniref:hypothetical protein n=1 Tax=Rhodococcus sp. FH8 TaxID=1761013 RepID=UPI001C4FB99A|nr:hypothetical protein [Rhodococcus sp. FH8]
MPASGSTKINKEIFDSIVARSKKSTPEEIAMQSGYKVSTVKFIRQAKTWEEFQRRRNAQAQRVSAKRAMNPAPRPVGTKTHRPPKPMKAPQPTPEPRHDEVTTHMLNEAYEESQATNRHLTALVEKLSERQEDLSLQHDSLKLDNRRNQSAIKALQDADSRRTVATNKSNRSWFPWSNR